MNLSHEKQEGQQKKEYLETRETTKLVTKS